MIKVTSGKNEIEYNDSPTARQRYKLNGQRAPGVTTFIKGSIPEGIGLINWKIKRAAEYVYDLVAEGTIATKEEILKRCLQIPEEKATAEALIGSILHDYAELCGSGKKEEALEFLAEHQSQDYWDRLLNSVQKFDDYYAHNQDEIVSLETIVGSVKHHYAGRFDRLAKRGKLLIMSDYKTSKRFYPDQFIQQASYAIAIKEWMGLEVNGLEIIRFGKEEGDKVFDPLLITDSDSIQKFKDQALRCRESYEFMKETNRDKRFK